MAKISLAKTTKSSAASYQTMVLARLTMRTTVALIRAMSPHCFAGAISVTLASSLQQQLTPSLFICSAYIQENQHYRMDTESYIPPAN